MTESLADIEAALRARPKRWLITGSAGFIGSHLLEALLRLGQQVVSIDNFSTGHQRNLDEVRSLVGETAWVRHQFTRGDLVDPATCRQVCIGVEIVLHQAALGSVPRSIADPLATHAANATGFVNLLAAAKECGVRRFIYAGSSSTYGDHPGLPKVEETIGRPLSPYAVTKYVNELYADVFSRCYGVETVGLRYFNVFGPRQDPDGPYAAVIPRWVRAMLAGEPCVINGDGQTSRDFCYVDNAVQANLRAAWATAPEALNQVYNVAVSERSTLIQLHGWLREALSTQCPDLSIPPPAHAGFRAGDVRHSQADIDKARRLLRYVPTHDVRAGLRTAIPWYVRRFSATAANA